MRRRAFYLCLTAPLALLAGAIVPAGLEAKAPSESPSTAAGTAPATTPRASAFDLDDLPLPIEEKQHRSAQQQDHIEALSLFATGRMEEQNEHLAAALRLYQRALRFEPESVPILRQIIPLAFSLDRPSEAVRYALRVVELEPADPLLLRQLGLHLTEAGRFDQAVKLYEQARERLAKQIRTAPYVMLTLELGRLCFVTDRPKEAADAFALVMQAMEKPEDFGLNETQRKVFSGDEGRKSLALFAEAFLLADRVDDALAAYNKLEQLRPDKTLHAYHLARISQKKKQPEQALEQLKAYFEGHATSAGQGPYELLVTSLTELGRQATIVEQLEAIVAAEPSNRNARLVLARAELEAGQSDKAEATYKELLKASATSDVYEGLIKIYTQADRPLDLLKVLGDAAVDSDATSLLDAQIQSIAKDAKLVDRLAAAAREENQAGADRLDYGDRMALAMLGMESKRYDLAEEFFELALKVKKQDAAAIYETWGVGLLMAEQYSAAAKVFQRAIDERVLPEGNTGFALYLAGALEMAGKTDEALAVARAGIAVPDAPPRMHSRLAWVLYHAKRYDDAYAAYQAFLQKFDSQYQSEDLRSQLRDARLVLSNICAIQDKVPQAEEWLEQVLDEYPENISALNDLGYLWAEQGKNLERAMRMVEQAVASAPENGAYRDSLGWVYYQLGRYPEALEQLKKATAEEEPDGTILDHLGDAYFKLNQVESARETWQKSIGAFERDKEAAKAAKVRQKLEAGGT